MGVSMKIDLKKELKELYFPPAKAPSIVRVPKMNFLMLDGKGSPSDEEYHQAIEVLYGVAYTLKFMLKKEGVTDFVVMPLEGLWWTEAKTGLDMSNKASWEWTALMLQPEQVTKSHVDKAIEELRRKKNPLGLSKLRFGAFDEGLAVQIMYIGPWADEKSTIEMLHAFADEKGYRLRGKHHEIYLSDPRRTAPGKLKTVIRQPVE
ncbi:MAG: hypothetical protein C4K49_07630 [Candidatus Thorarchaeota archaeon]|nr:MAG: hypothetical protein C4K49_07630 [Candidatus Thorarchaeota archaeon]